MLLRRFYDEKLAQASYLVGCAATGEALVVDANRDVEQYIRAAAAEGLRITHVTETHIHADFVSGSRELAHRTGARLYLSAEGGPGWRYAFAERDGAVLLRDGDAFKVGNVRIDVLHTPGHTPEHLSFMVTDTAATERAMGVLTGDFIFVGDVGRPDLLERAAGIAGTMEHAARMLFASLRRFRSLPDYLQLWPGHGAGSACGKALGAVPQTTLGYERLVSWAFAIEDEAEFVEAVLAGQPEPPRYFAEMKRINRDGPPLLGGIGKPTRLPDHWLANLVAQGEMVVDARPAAAFAGGHVPGTLNIPLDRSFTTWAGSLLPYGRDFHLVVDGSCASCAEEARRDLAMIGLDALSGYFTADAVGAWAAQGRELQQIEQRPVTALESLSAAADLAILDVRGRAEWEAGHIAGVLNIPLPELPARLAEVPSDRPLLVHCESGARSAIAVSLLRMHGFRRTVNLSGGFAAWRAAALPIELASPLPGEARELAA